jgi:hypothetical protein
MFANDVHGTLKIASLGVNEDRNHIMRITAGLLNIEREDVLDGEKMPPKINQLRSLPLPPNPTPLAGFATHVYGSDCTEPELNSRLTT